MAETLYNGIRLPDEWPPRHLGPESTDPMPAPYLDQPPEVIPVAIGRQLFVDDFLIADTTLERVFHLARKREDNPILRPETQLETEGPLPWRPDAPIPETWQRLPCAAPKDGGVWWDPAEGVFKMWYEAGWTGALAYATSEDGIHWQRPALDLTPPTNQIVPQLVGDSGAVVLDLESDDPSQRYKLFHRESNHAAGGHRAPGNSLVSADGIHWTEPVKTGPVEDRSTMFYNPFRKQWVYSIRAGLARGRARQYREHSDFLAGARWDDGELVYWCGADHLDLPDPDIGFPPQLYNLNAVAYESILLGLFEIHLGPENNVCEAEGHPKTTELKTAFSRDGFHWHRPDRRAFIPASRRPGIWDRGYVQSVGGICLIMGDELWFYYSGFMGRPDGDAPNDAGAVYCNGSTGIATLRRDGFASMTAGDTEGSVTTRPITFSGRHLFVNADVRPGGALRAELLDESGEVIAPFAREQSVPFTGDRTCVRLDWTHGQDLAALAGRPVRIRFTLASGSLYAFWVSPETSGASHGYVAAGGPGFHGPRDTTGTSG